MNDFRRWPALRGLRQPLPATLAHGRGVWGKVHEARSDYRWIAASAGFPRSGGLERELAVGRETPGRGLFWRPDPDRRVYFGGRLYPSRARDKAGRENFLEKQVLSFAMADDLPAALIALLILPVVANWGDDIWWERGSERLRTDHDHVLALPDSAPIPCSEAVVAAAVERGLKALRELDDGELEAWYAALTGGGCRVPADSRELPPEALAALLLPLDRILADRLSLVQWVPLDPSVRTDEAAMAGRWNLVLLPGAPAVFPAQTAGTDDAVRNLINALRRRDPGLPVVRRADSPRPARPSPLPDRTANARLLDPSEPIPPQARLALEPPPPGASAILGEIYAFAAEVDRRWLDVENYRDELAEISPNSDEAERLRDWAREVGNNRPHYADPRQWEQKVRVLEVLAACPGAAG